AAGGISNVSTTEYEPACLNVSCRQVATCCPSGMDDYGWIAAAIGWSLWFLTLILLCMDKIMKLRPDEPKLLVA
ncbi:TM213 protein, partial [Eulacestoma nigropectus]|nr:TM213 protein [Eulacestoma nigropectus]